MRRTQIYLDEDQKRSLRVLAAELDTNVSNLVREAIERLLRNPGKRPVRQQLGELAERMRESLGGGASDDEIVTAFASVRSESRGPRA